MQHPRVWPRGTKSATTAGESAAEPVADGALIAVFYAPDEPIATWIEDELEQADGARIQCARSMAAVVKALTLDPTPRPNVLIVDIDGLEPGELMELHSLRQLGWFGSLIALGTVPVDLRKSLAVDYVLAPPFHKNALRNAIATVRTPPATRRIPVIQISG